MNWKINKIKINVKNKIKVVLKLILKIKLI